MAVYPVAGESSPQAVIEHAKVTSFRSLARELTRYAFVTL